MKHLIVTADDFGADDSVNEAVERGHRDGILTAASLMVAAPAAADALSRAKAIPNLGVGLHLVLVEGRPMLPPERIPGLVDASGNFRTDMARTALGIFLRPAVRRQLEAEIEAQFAAFAATGLKLDHVNAHKHFHLHPTIASTILRVGKRHGMTAVRAPVEPGSGGIATPFARLLQRRLRRAGMTVPDQVYGLADSGAVTPERLRALVAALPEGLTEIYLHPATRDDWSGHAPGYRYRDELAALTDPGVRAALGTAHLGSFASFA
ncbi:hopanoid biosynthesis-associated protein HpnK [Sphingosinicellaceae bacterium]|nr:hopanoid biosynthesis-associated protein HpnK [Sphingosinicellaceae bacterium]